MHVIANGAGMDPCIMALSSHINCGEKFQTYWNFQLNEIEDLMNNDTDNKSVTN